MSQHETFQALIRPVTDFIGSRALNDALQLELNRQFPYDGRVCSDIRLACMDGVGQGWMCNYGADGLRYGRVIKPSEALNGYSVDVVDMKDIAGPHHRHPHGEIDLIMPIDPDAQFDGRTAGWLVYGPDSAHRPTVSKGRALVLYLLPQGKIEFTKTA